VSNDNVVKLIQPGALKDPLSEILRQGAHPVGASRRGRGRGFSHQACRSQERGWRPAHCAPRQPRVRDREVAADDPDRVDATVPAAFLRQPHRRVASSRCLGLAPDMSERRACRWVAALTSTSGEIAEAQYCQAERGPSPNLYGMIRESHPPEGPPWQLMTRSSSRWCAKRQPTSKNG
jgi:hypothetical protein